MAIYAIADLHLSLGVKKPMDIYGGEWVNYMEKIRENWKQNVGSEDLVLIVGDSSWATYIAEATMDFKFLHDLPGRKVLIKGNHDYWWTSAKKMEEFVTEHQFSSIRVLNNQIMRFEDAVLCGTRGWKCPTDPEFTKEDMVIYEREMTRLKNLLKEVSKNRKPGEKVIVGLHFPPFDRNNGQTGFSALLSEFQVNICCYGHLHNAKEENIVQGMKNGVEYRFVTADYLKFTPQKINEKIGEDLY